MDLEKYKNTGWGLSRKAYEALGNAMDPMEELNVIEFGSGFSTQFFLDYAEHKNKPLHMDSFDNDPGYKHEKAQLVDLVECADKAYDTMLADEKIDFSLFKKRFWRPKSRQRNCFYRIDESTLRTTYNVALIDGPNGNGRNFAFLLLKNRIKGGFILIDDFNHYDFLQVAQQIFELEIIVRNEEERDNFVLVKIKS